MHRLINADGALKKHAAHLGISFDLHQDYHRGQAIRINPPTADTMRPTALAQGMHNMAGQQQLGMAPTRFGAQIQPVYIQQHGSAMPPQRLPNPQEHLQAMNPAFQQQSHQAHLLLHGSPQLSPQVIRMPPQVSQAAGQPIGPSGQSQVHPTQSGASNAIATASNALSQSAPSEQNTFFTYNPPTGSFP